MSPPSRARVDDLLDQLHAKIAQAATAAAALEPQAMAGHHQQLVGLVGALREAGASSATLAGVRRRIERHFAFVQALGRQIGEGLERAGLVAPAAYAPHSPPVPPAAARPLHQQVG